MPQLLLTLFLFGLAVVAIKVALAFLLLAGLIFRTRETLSLLFFLGVFALFRQHPAAGIGGSIVFGLLWLWSYRRRRREPRALEKHPDRSG